MAGTLSGGRKAAKTNIKKHGKDFYANIGRLGGKAGNTGGFASGKLCKCELIKEEHAYQRCAGKKGGAKSKRGKPLAERETPIQIEEPSGGVLPTPENGFEPTKSKKKFWLW